MDKSITENANQLQKLVMGPGSYTASEQTRHDEGSQSRPFTDNQNPSHQQDNQGAQYHHIPRTRDHFGILDYQAQVPIQLQKSQKNQIRNKPTTSQPIEQQNNDEALEFQEVSKGERHIKNLTDRSVNLQQKERLQLNPNYIHDTTNPDLPLIEEDADTCLSISGYPERPLSTSESTALQRRPLPDSQCQPTDTDRQQTTPEGQPTSLERQATSSENQPTNQQGKKSSRECQAAGDTKAVSFSGYLGPSRLPTEHVHPAEDEDESYRRMMSEELGKQWRDELEASETTWSIVSSLIESGYSEGTSPRSCRKCDLAEDMFLCPESRVFWKKVKGNTCCKRIWKDFFDELKGEFPEERALDKKRVVNTLRCLLGVQFQELNDVTIENYLKFIRFFGPFRQEENRCVAIRQLEYLVENSSQQSKNKRSKLCWFAGYMTRQEAEEKLVGQEPGTFLLRMSGLGGMEGSFVVSLVMKDRQLEHFQIKGNPVEAVSTHPFSQELEFKGQQFSSLPDLVNNCLRVTTVFDTDDPANGVRCKTICPNLPFNHILDGYKI